MVEMEYLVKGMTEVMEIHMVLLEEVAQVLLEYTAMPQDTEHLHTVVTRLENPEVLVQILEMQTIITHNEQAVEEAVSVITRLMAMVLQVPVGEVVLEQVTQVAEMVAVLLLILAVVVVAVVVLDTLELEEGTVVLEL